MVALPATFSSALSHIRARPSPFPSLARRAPSLSRMRERVDRGGIAGASGVRVSRLLSANVRDRAAKPDILPARQILEETRMASNGKVALVTGGGSGIGKASALALAREGFAVVVAGRRPEPLDAVVAEIEGLQGKALGVATDVSDPASVEALFAKTKATFGRLDVLFNNAGFGAAGLLEDLEFDKWMGVVGSI